MTSLTKTNLCPASMQPPHVFPSKPCADRKLYVACPECGKVVKLNLPFGDWRKRRFPNHTPEQQKEVA